eukprot:CAMPEP_0115848832 /NCGR_PEP_ID=MMETSP0287-20121206/11132_1 /TAXON_ID=412157 /ORGANISM="Chrysochromulina rotalis, Strain UIO044" /LENGTH=63 /DNA_ID=CAMNT_0003302771 /DNA_START=530 /DNA_END=718 /DNA_ORIENTATION=+
MVPEVAKPRPHCRNRDLNVETTASLWKHGPTVEPWPHCGGGRGGGMPGGGMPGGGMPGGGMPG